MTELGLEDISYVHGDLRLHLTPEALNNKFHLSVGVKHRQHPVYGFDGIIYWTQLGTEDNGGTFEDIFGIDDNMWFDPTMIDEDGNGYIKTFMSMML